MVFSFQKIYSRVLHICQIIALPVSSTVNTSEEWMVSCLCNSCYYTALAYSHYWCTCWFYTRRTKSTSNNNKVKSPSYLALMIQNLASLLIFGVCMYIIEVFTHCFEWLYGNKNASSPAGQSLWLVWKPDLKFQLSRASRIPFVSNPDIKKKTTLWSMDLRYLAFIWSIHYANNLFLMIGSLHLICNYILHSRYTLYTYFYN